MNRFILCMMLILISSTSFAQTRYPPGLSSVAGLTGAPTASQLGAAITATPNGVSSAYSTNLSAVSAQSGVLLDTFKLAGDADDTASLTRAVAAGVPILLGPRTYTINNYSSSAVPNFILRGIPKQSVIQRTTASGSQFFSIAATNVTIDGVTFDMNKAAVTANQWGVFLGTGGQTVSVTRSVFKNNSGSLGDCFNLLATGPAAGGSFVFSNNEVTGCAFNGVYFGSVSDGQVESNYVHDNSSFGMFAGTFGTASATNYLTNVKFIDNRFERNATGLAIGGFSAPYTFGTPAATNVTSSDNHFVDISGTGLVLQGDNLWSSGDKFYQSAPGVSVNTGIDCNSRYQHILGDIINYAGASYGIDCGGSVGANVKNNFVTMTSGAAFDSGGNQNGVYTGNTASLSGTAVGFINYSTETDGSGSPFPTLASGTSISSNTINISSSSNVGIDLLDNAGGQTGATPMVVRDNIFNVTGSGTNAAQDIVWYGAAGSLLISGNSHNGSKTQSIAPNGNNDIIFENVYFGGNVASLGAVSTIRSIIPSAVNSFGSSDILYAYPTSGGSGYVQSTTTLSASGTGGGSGWAGTALVYGGQIIGVRTTSKGSGYSGTITITATDTSGGSGAVIVAGNSVPLPSRSTIAYINFSSVSQIIQGGGGFIGLSPAVPIEVNSNQVASLVAISSNAWGIVSTNVPTFAVGSLPTCNSTSLGALANVTGSTTGKWQARCNGTNWIWSDGTTVTT